MEVVTLANNKNSEQGIPKIWERRNQKELERTERTILKVTNRQDMITLARKGEISAATTTVITNSNITPTRLSLSSKEKVTIHLQLNPKHHPTEDQYLSHPFKVTINLQLNPKLHPTKDEYVSHPFITRSEKAFRIQASSEYGIFSSPYHHLLHHQEHITRPHPISIKKRNSFAKHPTPKMLT